MNNYDAVFEHDCARFVKLDVDDIIAHTSTSKTADNKYIKISYFYKEYLVRIEDGQIFKDYKEKEMEEAGVGSKLVIMHHLVGAKGNALSGNLIPFRQIENASPFNAAFVRWSIDPIREYFQGKLDLFIKAGEFIGAKREKYGHASFTLEAFPMIPVTLIFWEGDDEVPASANILFDDTIREFIHEEDVSVIGRDASYLMIETAKRIDNKL